MIVTLALSAAEAYHIQISVSEHHLDIYRNYAEEEASLSALRRNLWLVGNDVRDFFIGPSDERAILLSRQIRDLEDDDRRVFAKLKQIAGPSYNPYADLEARMNRFWKSVEPVPAAMAHATQDQDFAFLQSVIVPRREELYNQLIALGAVGQQRLEQNERAFSETRRTAATRLVGLLALGLLLSLIVALLSVRHSESLESAAARHLAEIEQARSDLQQLSARLLEVEEEGRRKLSRELHDEIGQTLALLQIEISHAAAAPPGSARERLLRARELAEEVVRSVHTMAVLLRPALLDDLGLMPALQFLVEDFLRRTSLACELTGEGVEDDLPDAAKTCVYRVVQEALHNCEKHARAANVRVMVRQAAGTLSAEIEDDGCGFSTAAAGKMPRAGRMGLGLLGMRERAAIAGGLLAIESAPGKGTRVLLQIPLPAPDGKVESKRLEVHA